MRFADKRLTERLDKMLEEGINGTFNESDYDETMLSRLETKWFNYLTSSKLSRQRSEAERERIKELVSDISHQTRTPLSNILLYIQLLKERELDDKSRELVDEISRQSEKLEFLIQSLVKTSRLETGTFEMSVREGDIADVIREAVKQIAPAAERKRIRLVCSFDSCAAVFDGKWTREALFNVLDNAVKYSPEASEVRISLDVFELFVCVLIEDEGPGIAENEQSLIFTRFYRGRDVRDRDGVGIGLYLSRRIIEEQGGYITVAPAAGGGSVFKIFLPR